MKSIIPLTLLLLLVMVGSGYYFRLDKSHISPIQFLEQSNKSTLPFPTASVPKTCDGKLTPNMTDGPYYKEGSPERTALDSEVQGEKLKLKGYVFDTNCNPVAHAWVDFWQANSQGLYDNENYILRGHQYTDGNGRYHLETIIPGSYTGRTPHIHVKVQANPTSPLITTQLYFPGQPTNSKDEIFDQATLIKIENTDSGKLGYYNFVVSVK